jgi:predicted CopG family antitoxin
MAIRTISLKQEAYDRLKAARRYPAESFSEVVLRATWPEDTVSARDLLTLYGETGPRLSDAVLDRLETVRSLDAPPVDKWANP